MKPELITMCQMFLVPASVLVTALGIARTEGLKVGVSIIGIVISLIWITRILLWPGLTDVDMFTALALAGTVFFASIVSLVVHVKEWRKESERKPVMDHQ